MGKRASKRIPMPVQLKVGDDDDLIQWYTSLEKGTRQEHVKRMLRMALGIEPEPQPRLQPVTLDDLQTIMLQQKNSMFHQINNALDARDEELLGKVREMLENMGAFYPHESVLQPADFGSSSTVDEETLRRREANMSQEDW